MPSEAHPKTRRIHRDGLTAIESSYFVIFDLMLSLSDIASQSFDKSYPSSVIRAHTVTDRCVWYLLQCIWHAHLTSQDIYLGDLFHPDFRPESLRAGAEYLTAEGWLAAQPSLPKLDPTPLRLTPEGARKAQALSTNLLRSIHEHCSLAGLLPFTRRQPAWAMINNPRQSRSNRRSHPHRRQS